MAFSSPDGRTSTSLAEINVTPLVDVMLVLLIIFMVTTPIIHSGIEVSLPKTRFVKSANPKQHTIITIDERKNVYFLTRPINVDDLAETLKKHMASDTSQPVYLQADGGVPFSQVVRVMDEVRGAGFSNIQVVTKPAREGKAK